MNGRRLALSGRTNDHRGFTLVELLAVVAMVGILAALALLGYGKYLKAARAGECKEMIGGIRAAQHSYKAETLGYLNVSASLTDWYPATPNGKKRSWLVPKGNPVGDRWRMLNVTADTPTYFGFACIAGVPPAVPPPVPNLTTSPDWNNYSITEPWFVVQAAGDHDDDGILGYFLSSSFSGEIYWENEDE